MSVRHRWLALALMALAAGPSPAQEQAFRLDPVHTRVAFRVDHAGYSRALGTFAGVTGELAFDPADWRGARLDVRIPLASLDLGDADWNKKVLGRAFLDAGDQPEARFTSSHVEPLGENEARITGQLSLRDQAHEVTLHVTLNALKRHPLTFRQTAGFSATGTLSRKAFGIDTWPNVIGDSVELLIEAEAIRSPSGTASPDTPSDTPSPTENPDAPQE